MTRRQRRPQQQTGWMDGYQPAQSVEAAALAMEARLRNREGCPTMFPDAIARLPFSEIERWSD